MRSETKSGASPISWLILLGCILLLMAGAVWLIRSDLFPVRHARFITPNDTPLRHVKQEDLLQAQSELVHGNIFQLNLNQIQTRFEQIRWVREAHIRRIWPDTVQIQIHERHPVARWNKNALLDEEGTLFYEKVDDTLPHFSAPEGTETVVLELYQNIAPLLKSKGLEITHLDYSERSALQVELNHQFTLKLGRKNNIERTERFVRYWDRVLKPQQNHLRYVNMCYRKGFAIKRKESNTPAPNSQNTSKNHS